MQSDQAEVHANAFLRRRMHSAAGSQSPPTLDRPHFGGQPKTDAALFDLRIPAGSSRCAARFRVQSPAIVKPSTSRLGTQYGLNVRGSLAGINVFRKCFRLPAIVSSLTGYLISPFSTQNPDAPRE